MSGNDDFLKRIESKEGSLESYHRIGALNNHHHLYNNIELKSSKCKTTKHSRIDLKNCMKILEINGLTFIFQVT